MEDGTTADEFPEPNDSHYFDERINEVLTAIERLTYLKPSITVEEFTDRALAVLEHAHGVLAQLQAKEDDRVALISQMTECVDMLKYSLSQYEGCR